MALGFDAEDVTTVVVGGVDRAMLVYDSTTHLFKYRDQAGSTFSLVAGVSSFNTRTGAIVPQQADYDSFFLTPAEGSAAYDALGLAAAAQAFAIQRANHTGTQAVGTITGLAAIATSGSATDLSAGAVPAARMPALTGDITTVAGAVATTIGASKVLTSMIADANVTNAKLANMAAATVKGSVAGGVPADLTSAQATSILDVANATTKGLMSATDNSSLDSFVAAQLYYNVKDYGAVGDGTHDDLANINTAITTIPSGATLYFPRGTYKISGTISVPVGKSIRFLGGGKGFSVITTNHATLDMVNVGDWNTDFVDIGFATSVTRTGGYAVNGGSYNGGFWIVGMNFTRCGFAAMYNGILCNGTLCWFKDLSFTNTVNFSMEFGGTGPAGFTAPNTGLDGPNVNSLIHNCTFDCAPASVAHIEVKQCGSLIISDCDIIRATNNLRINPSTTLKGAFSIYCCNTFFDTAGGSSVKFQGVGNIQRAKFTNCWFSGSVNGVEFASTATTLPTGIDFVNCDMFSNSQNGMLATAVQDFSVTNSRISANATAGINVLASAGSVTKFNIQGNSIGPTAGLGANTIGVNIQAGTYGGYNVTGNIVAGNTSNNNIIDLGTVATTDLSNVEDNLGHAMKGIIASLAAIVTVPITTETLVLTARIPANAVRAGATFRCKCEGITSSTNATTFRVRVGAAGTVADASVVWVSKATAASVANGRTGCDVLVTIRSIGAGTIAGEGVAHSEAAFVTAVVATATAPAVTTTAPWFIDITAATTIGSVAMQVATVEAL